MRNSTNTEPKWSPNGIKKVTRIRGERKHIKKDMPKVRRTNDADERPAWNDTNRHLQNLTSIIWRPGDDLNSSKISAMISTVISHALHPPRWGAADQNYLKCRPRATLGTIFEILEGSRKVIFVEVFVIGKKLVKCFCKS